MFAIGQTLIVNDPVDTIMNGSRVVVKNIARFGKVTVYTVTFERNPTWSTAYRADKLVAL